MQKSKRRCFPLRKSNKTKQSSAAVCYILTSPAGWLIYKHGQRGRNKARYQILFALCQARLYLLFFSISLATSVLLNKAGNCFSLQLVAARPPALQGLRGGCLGHAPEGCSWHSQGLGGHLASQRFHLQGALWPLHFSCTLRW